MEKSRHKEILDRDETVEVGDYKVLRSGPSVGGLIPKNIARMLGVLEAGELTCHVNFEEGVIIHELPDDGEE